MALRVGQKAPDFTLVSDQGTAVNLSEFAGRKVVLYFYPKDQTPGCTVEACDFRDRHDRILKTGAVVLGVSKDGVESHQKFKSKEHLPFPLLSDPDAQVMKRYGAWGEKNLYGKKVEGTIRTTVLLDESGRVIKVWPKVKAEGHAEEVLRKLA